MGFCPYDTTGFCLIQLFFSEILIFSFLITQ